MKISTMFRSSALAGVLLAGVSSVAAAAPCVTATYAGQTSVGARTGINNAADGRNIASVCGVATTTGGSQAKVFVTILGGSALYGNSLYFLGSPDAAPGTSAIGTGLFIPPSSAYGQNPFIVPVLIRVQLPGLFNIGQSLSFALDSRTDNPPAGANQRVFSATDNSMFGPGQLFAFGQGAVVYLDNRVTPVSNTPQFKGITYGFGDLTGDQDFNDLVFMVEAEVVPEPVTMTLVATGLAGIGALRRRKNRKA